MPKTPLNGTSESLSHFVKIRELLQFDESTSNQQWRIQEVHRVTVNPLASPTGVILTLLKRNQHNLSRENNIKLLVTPATFYGSAPDLSISIISNATSVKDCTVRWCIDLY